MGKMGDGLKVVTINKEKMTYKTSDGEERVFLFGVDDIDGLTVDAMNQDLERWLKVFSDLEDVDGE